jgi:hypothetical protein
MRVLICLLSLLILYSCNQDTTPPVAEATPEIRSLSITGFTSVNYILKDGFTFVFFEPVIPRDDTAMSYAFLELGEQLFKLKKKPWPVQDLVDVGQGKAIRYKYKSKSLIFIPMKNDDGTIHTVMVKEGEL